MRPGKWRWVIDQGGGFVLGCALYQLGFKFLSFLYMAMDYSCLVSLEAFQFWIEESVQWSS